MNPIILYSLIGAGALIFFSYGKTAKKLANLKVSLHNPLKIHNSVKDIVTTKILKLNLSLRIVNAGTNEVTINNISGNVETEEGGLLASFVKTASKDAWVCKPNGAATIIEGLMVNIELGSAINSISPLLKKGLPIKVSGTLTAEGNAIPFTMSDTIKVDLTSALDNVIDAFESAGLDKLADGVFNLKKGLKKFLG